MTYSEKIFESSNKIEDQIASKGFGLTYNEITKLGKFISEQIKDNIPMHLGKINSKWIFWQDVIYEFDRRILNNSK